MQSGCLAISGLVMLPGGLHSGDARRRPVNAKQAVVVASMRSPRCVRGRFSMTIATVLMIVLLLFLVGAMPTWPHSRSWGYAPSGLIGTVLVLLIVFWLLGKI